MTDHTFVALLTALSVAVAVLMFAASFRTKSRAREWDMHVETAINVANSEMDKINQCQICGCTDDYPCPTGCCWATSDNDICSICANAVYGDR